MKEESVEIFRGNYITLWSDGSMTVDDGVGFVGVEDNLEGLKDALMTIYPRNEEQK